MSEPRRDTILWDEETKRRAQELADANERSMSAEIRYRINCAWEQLKNPRYILTDESVPYETRQRIERVLNAPRLTETA